MSTPNRQPFVGRWIGQTIGPLAAAHVWDVIDRGSFYEIRTRWEGEGVAHALRGRPLDDARFEIHGSEATFTATLVDPLHFIIPGWDTNDTRGFKGPEYDVVFSRPGLAELMARQVWEQTRAGLSQPRPTPNPPGLTYIDPRIRRKRVVRRA
ncbi:MAG: hypothetical protein JNL73_06655 [Anaerolineales bacterium]|nr:hypothetical protein [Anaerolineales bacterium]